MSQMLRYGVYASRWPLGEQTVWTIVNRNEYDVDGDQIEVPAGEDVRYFYLYHGVELKRQTRPDGKVVLAFPIEAKGYGGLFSFEKAVALKSRWDFAQLSEWFDRTLPQAPTSGDGAGWRTAPSPAPVPIDP